MNAVEIEQAITDLADQPFDPAEFPFAFLECFDNSPARAKRLRKKQTNKSDIGGVLQVNNIHIKVADHGHVSDTLRELRESPGTQNKRNRVKFILSTDGQSLEAEDLNSGETVACSYEEFPDKFGFFLPLAGITTVKQIRENTFDVRATSRLNKLYMTLLQENPDWGTEDRRHDLNHFMGRLIFCFFAEDTDIFNGDDLFTATISQMSERDSSNTHEVISEIFRAMDVKIEERANANLPRWADVFPYVNGELFSGSTEVPKFSRIAKKYLLHIGNLDWKQINPDIFGSMIQAVADEEERSDLGMHYTSVPNILKVLNPLFLNELKQQLDDAGNNPRKLLNLRKRMSSIRVFDPACGSGNFLVIAYKEMRKIEAEINKRRGERGHKTEIPLTNFRGIELRDFSAEIARLALIIAEYQADVVHIGQKEARQAFLPLDAQNWITSGNALRLDWLDICPPTGQAVKITSEDLFDTPLDQVEIDFENEGGETYICGNPPFKGTRKQKPEEKADLERVFASQTSKWKNVDYVGAWLMKAALYNDHCEAPFAFVSTNSLCQGQQVPITWDILQKLGFRIRFAHRSFKWSNLAANKAGVTVVVAGVDRIPGGQRWIFDGDEQKAVENINPYLTHHKIAVVQAERRPRFLPVPMEYGVYYSKSAGLMLDPAEKGALSKEGVPTKFLRRFIGSTEFINGKERYCLWIGDDEVEEARSFKTIADRIDSVKADRTATSDGAVNKLAKKPHQFRERKGDEGQKLFVPIVSSESREYFPAGIETRSTVPTNKAFFVPEGPLWCVAILCSKTHLAWIDAICGRLEMRYSYSNTLGWNTFPIPKLTEKQKIDLAECAAEVLLSREKHFPATIADLYDPEKMPEELQAAHDRNDETLERIYMGRRFKNDTERLEKLFDMYTKMTTKAFLQ